jgi:hypothetical protein
LTYSPPTLTSSLPAAFINTTKGQGFSAFTVPNRRSIFISPNLLPYIAELKTIDPQLESFFPSERTFSMKANADSAVLVSRLMEALDPWLISKAENVCNGHPCEAQNLREFGYLLREIWAEAGYEDRFGDLGAVLLNILGKIRKNNDEFFLAYKALDLMSPGASQQEKLNCLAAYGTGLAMHLRELGLHDNCLSKKYLGELRVDGITAIAMNAYAGTILDEELLIKTVRQFIPLAILNAAELKEKKLECTIRACPETVFSDFNSPALTAYDQVMWAARQMLDLTLHLPQSFFQDDFSHFRGNMVDYFAVRRWGNEFQDFNTRTKQWSKSRQDNTIDWERFSKHNEKVIESYVSRTFLNLTFPNGKAVPDNALREFLGDLLNWESAHRATGLSELWSESGYRQSLEIFRHIKFTDREPNWFRSFRELGARSSLDLKFALALMAPIVGSAAKFRSSSNSPVFWLNSLKRDQGDSHIYSLDSLGQHIFSILSE